MVYSAKMRDVTLMGISLTVVAGTNVSAVDSSSTTSDPTADAADFTPAKPFLSVSERPLSLVQ
jgi:hypothetical protein